MAVITAIRATGDEFPPGALSRGERCALARRRSGATLHRAATAAGVSMPLYGPLERAGDERVAAVWRNLGFRGI